MCSIQPRWKITGTWRNNVWDEDRDAIILWDIVSGSQLGILKGYTRSINSLVFSLDGKTLASGSADNTIRLWDVKTQKHIYTLTGHSSETYLLRIQ